MLTARIALRASGGLKFSSAFNIGAAQRETQELATSLSERIASNNEACSLVVDSLNDAGRRQLLHALLAHEGQGLSEGSIDSLFKAHDTKSPFGLIERSEFEAAILADRAARAAKATAKASDVPQASVFSIALASSIPFVGMGAVDNAIMLVAGSEIDAVFGAKLGLSTLAAAGLGNMVSDVAGVSIANRLENMTRKIKWFNDTAYKAGSRSRRGRAAKFTGSVIGVSIGCLIGMAPLLFVETHDHEGR